MSDESNEKIQALLQIIKHEKKRIAELEAERDALFEENGELSDKQSEYELTIRDLTDGLPMG